MTGWRGKAVAGKDAWRCAGTLLRRLGRPLVAEPRRGSAQRARNVEPRRPLGCAWLVQEQKALFPDKRMDLAPGAGLTDQLVVDVDLLLLHLQRAMRRPPAWHRVRSGRSVKCGTKLVRPCSRRVYEWRGRSIGVRLIVAAEGVAHAAGARA